MKYAVAYEIANAMKYAAAYRIYFISLSALAENFIIRRIISYFRQENISLNTHLIKFLQ